MKPHRTVCKPIDYEEDRKTIIREKFMEIMRKELLETSLEKETNKP